ncbi:MAG: hypothetical protein WDO15_18950 [Bacteroidota bacterium]
MALLTLLNCVTSTASTIKSMPVEPPATSLALDDKFYAMLGKAKKRQESSSFSFTMPS